MAEPKIYVPRSSAKEISFGEDRSILKLSFKVEELLKFAQEHRNERGYLNLILSRRQEVGQYGDTHSVALDTWKPGDKRSGQAQEPQRPAPRREAPKSSSTETTPADETEPPF